MPPAWSSGRVRLVTVGVMAVLLLWPTLLNAHPYLFWDTYGYFTQGRTYWTLIGAALGLLPLPPEVAVEGWIGAAGRMIPLDPAIRSISYSLLLWPLAAVAGSFWLLAALNALAAAYTVDVALERLLGLGLRRRALVLATLLLLSPLPWLASYVMPDLFAGLMLLAMATLAFAHERLAAGQRVALLALILLGASFHAANLPLAAGLVLLAMIMAPAGRRLTVAARLGAPVVGAVLLLMVLGWLAFGTPGLAPRSPPFLLARQVEDGPAVAYLRARCGREDWALCPHLDRMWHNAQDFLWSPESSYWAWEDLRARLRAEERALVLRAALAHPGQQLRASLGNTLRQLGMIGLDDLVLGRGALVRPEDYWFTYNRDVPARLHGLGGFSALLYGTATLSLVVLLWHAWPPPGRERRGLSRPAWLLLLGLVLNAAVCGALSGPHHRYQARVAWLLPLLAATLLVRPGGGLRPAAADAPGAAGP